MPRKMRLPVMLLAKTWPWLRKTMASSRPPVAARSMALERALGSAASMVEAGTRLRVSLKWVLGHGFGWGGEEGSLAASDSAGSNGSLLNVSELLSHFCIFL